MTLNTFIQIIRRIINSEMMYRFERPDAVCVSRKLYYDLLLDVHTVFPVVSYKIDADSSASEPGDCVCGLRIFVDDEMPDDYYQVGYASQFRELFKGRWKRISKRYVEEGI